MDLFEYQAKELFDKHNVPTTPGRVTDTAEGAKAIAEEIGRPVMVKAQVKTGGRGKAGGVKYAATPDDAFTHAQNILGLDIKGHIVKKLLVSEASDIAEEYYISFLLDRANRTYLAMCSVEGGMEIEEVAATKSFFTMWPLMSRPRMFCACVNASSGVAAYFTPPALPRPPVLTWAFTITGLPISSAIAFASSAVVVTRPGVVGTLCLANSSFA